MTIFAVLAVQVAAPASRPLGSYLPVRAALPRRAALRSVSPAAGQVQPVGASTSYGQLDVAIARPIVGIGSTPDSATGLPGRAVQIIRDGNQASGSHAIISSSGAVTQFRAVPSPAGTGLPSPPSSGPGQVPAAGGTSPAPSAAPGAGGPLLNAVGAPASAQQLAGAGYASVVIPASWAAVEPAEGRYSAAAVGQIQSEIDLATAAHLVATLDVGSQYAPSWVFSLGGGTRFVDQYGTAFSGAPGSGDDVANAVTDAAVRSRLGQYLAYLGSHLRDVGAIRIGGGPDNELRYPSGYAGGGPNAFWFYDPSSQASLPASLQGWKPGTGSAAQAAQFLSYYNGALDQFGRWLVGQGQSDFPATTKVELLLPGWGQRPGEAATASSALLIVPADEINEGLDWTDLLPSLPADGRVVAYTTWADALSGGPTNPAPAQFIHSLLRPGLLEGGESTGNGQSTLAGASAMFQEARQWGWFSVGWFFPGQDQSVSQISALFMSS